MVGFEGYIGETLVLNTKSATTGGGHPQKGYIGETLVLNTKSATTGSGHTQKSNLNFPSTIIAPPIISVAQNQFYHNKCFFPN